MPKAKDMHTPPPASLVSDKAALAMLDTISNLSGNSDQAPSGPPQLKALREEFACLQAEMTALPEDTAMKSSSAASRSPTHAIKFLSRSTISLPHLLLTWRLKPPLFKTILRKPAVITLTPHIPWQRIASALLPWRLFLPNPDAELIALCQHFDDLELRSDALIEESDHLNDEAIASISAQQRALAEQIARTPFTTIDGARVIARAGAIWAKDAISDRFAELGELHGDLYFTLVKGLIGEARS